MRDVYRRKIIQVEGLELTCRWGEEDALILALLKSRVVRTRWMGTEGVPEYPTITGVMEEVKHMPEIRIYVVCEVVEGG